MYAPPIDVNDITKALSIWKVEDKTEFFLCWEKLTTGDCVWAVPIDWPIACGGKCDDTT